MKSTKRILSQMSGITKPRQKFLIILNREVYRLRKVLKIKPLKKIPETDAIFKNIGKENEKADKSPDIIRISADVKARVRVGRFSRGGKAERLCSESAPDHDYTPDAVPDPFGVSETDSGQVTIVFGESKETGDFIADASERRYEIRKTRISDYIELLINPDNGPSVGSNRTRFLRGMVMFAKKTGKILHELIQTFSPIKFRRLIIAKAMR